MRNAFKSLLLALGAACLLGGVTDGLAVAKSPRQQPRPNPTGRVVGTVKDRLGSRLTGSTIVFKGQGVERKVVAGQQGRYEVELPAGTYRVTFSEPEFYPYRRASFHVRPGATITINVAPVRRASGSALVFEPGKGSRHVDVDVTPPLKYDSYITRGRGGESRQLLIQYQQKKASRHHVEYVQSVATSEDIAVFARRLRLDTRTLEVAPVGDFFMIEDGEKVLTGSRARVSFKATEPVITVDGANSSQQ